MFLLYFAELSLTTINFLELVQEYHLLFFQPMMICQDLRHQCQSAVMNQYRHPSPLKNLVPYITLLQWLHLGLYIYIYIYSCKFYIFLSVDKTKKRRLNSATSADTNFESSLLEAIKSNQPPPRANNVDLFCSFLATRLKKLKSRLYNDITHTFMNELIRTELQQRNDEDY